MTELPPGWCQTSVGEVCQRVRGVSYSKSEASRQEKEGLVPILRANNIVDDRVTFDDLIFVPSYRVAERQKLKAKDVLVAMSSGSKRVVGKTAQVAEDWKGSFGAFCGVLRPRLEIDGDFFGYFFRTAAYRSIISELASGTNINNLKNEHFESLNFPLPPLNEQQRIVAKLERFLSRVNAAQERLATISRILKRLRQSILVNAFASTKGYSRKRISEIFLVQTGGTPNRRNSKFFEDGTIPWVKTTEIQNCDIYRSEEFITEEALNNSNAKVFPVGSLLIAMYGEGKTRGQVGRLQIKAATNQACAALVNGDLSEESNQYVFLFLLSQYHKLRAEAVGGNQPNLNLSIIKSWCVPFPPENKQREIVRRVEALFKTADTLEARYLKAKAHVDKLTQSILAKAFRGELVPQDPNDEPASVLLERITAERNGSALVKRRSRK